jgi:hypothetical protein
MKLVEVSKTEKLKTLRSNPYFDDLPESVLKDIADKTQLREFEQRRGPKVSKPLGLFFYLRFTL